MRKSEDLREAIQEHEPFGKNDGQMLERFGIKAGRSYEQKKLRKAGYSTFVVPCGDCENEYELKYVYTGNYYRQNMSIGSQILVRLAYAALLACAVLLFLSSAWIVPLNSVWYVTLPQAVCIPMFAWLLKNIGAGLMSVSQDLEEREYRALSAGTKKAAAGAVVGCVVETAAVLLFIIINGINIPSVEVGCAVKYAVCAVIMFAVYRIEMHIRYDVIEQEPDIPEDYIPLG